MNTSEQVTSTTDIAVSLSSEEVNMIPPIERLNVLRSQLETSQVCIRVRVSDELTSRIEI